MKRALSVYLDLARFAAALLVFVVHLNYDRFSNGLPFLWRVADMGNDAVMVFFVLSGYVIAYIAEQREHRLSDYCASRMARLWSVAVPALLVTMLLDAIGSRLAPPLYDGWWYQADMPWLRFIANACFVNELWFMSVRPFSNGPFWSLGYEFWYYVLFAALHFLRGRSRVVAITLVAAIVGPKVLLLLPVWLLGVWAYRSGTQRRWSVRAGGLLWLGSIALYVAIRLFELPALLHAATIGLLGEEFVKNDLAWSQHFIVSYAIGLAVALNFLGATALAAHLDDMTTLPGERVIRACANYTFALYLLHYPLLQFFAALSVRYSLVQWQRPIVVLGTTLGVWAIGGWAEAQKHPLKRGLLHLAAHLGILRRQR